VYIYFRHKFNVGLNLRRHYITGVQRKAKTNVWGYGDEALKLMLFFLLVPPSAIFDNTDVTQHTVCRF
jgi:hypothetical protein